MTEHKALKLSKWPFYVGDLLLLAVAGWIVSRPAPGSWPFFLVAACAVAGACISVTPFLVEHRAALKFAEADALATTVEQIENLRTFTNQISFATAQWQVVQEHAAKTVSSAQQIAERIVAEAQAFSEFMQKANDAEKAHLRLEIEKLRRAEGEWLHSVVRLLDHVYALHQAGLRSGQPVLIDQLSHFQKACREAVRRLGLVPFEVKPGELFNDHAHQLVDSEAKPPAEARVGETIATGYTFQGQHLRSALVKLKSVAVVEPESDAVNVI